MVLLLVVVLALSFCMVQVHADSLSFPESGMKGENDNTEVMVDPTSFSTTPNRHLRVRDEGDGLIDKANSYFTVDEGDGEHFYGSKAGKGAKGGKSLGSYYYETKMQYGTKGSKGAKGIRCGRKGSKGSKSYQGDDDDDGDDDVDFVSKVPPQEIANSNDPIRRKTQDVVEAQLELQGPIKDGSPEIGLGDDDDDDDGGGDDDDDGALIERRRSATFFVSFNSHNIAPSFCFPPVETQFSDDDACICPALVGNSNDMSETFVGDSYYDDECCCEEIVSPVDSPAYSPFYSPVYSPFYIPIPPPIAAPVVVSSPPVAAEPTTPPVAPPVSSPPTGDDLPCPNLGEGGCNICGDGKAVGSVDSVFVFPGQLPVPCGVLESAGAAGSVPAAQCSFLPPLLSMCECTPCGGSGMDTMPPAAPAPVAPLPMTPAPMAPLPTSLPPVTSPTTDPTLCPGEMILNMGCYKCGQSLDCVIDDSTAMLTLQQMNEIETVLNNFNFCEPQGSGGNCKTACVNSNDFQQDCDTAQFAFVSQATLCCLPTPTVGGIACPIRGQDLSNFGGYKVTFCPNDVSSSIVTCMASTFCDAGTCSCDFCSSSCSSGSGICMQDFANTDDGTCGPPGRYLLEAGAT